MRCLEALFIVTFVAGCGGTTPPDRMTIVPDDDPQMNAAIQKARAGVDAFIAALKSPKATQSGFSIKFPFKDGKETEHIWLSPITFDGGKFHGVVNNDPELVKNVKLGQKVTALPNEISDWMYVENGKLVGGETLRVLRAKMSESERAEFDKSVPFVIE